MANIQHSALTSSDLHEPKGVAGAGASQVYIADGVGSGVWTATTAIITTFPIAGYISGAQTITASSKLTLAHSLGSIPRLITLKLQCISGELGYVTNDEISILSYSVSADTPESGVTMWADATNVYIRTAPSIRVISTISVASTIAMGQWKYLVEAWA